ncbi:hypothetical protein [Flavobacterium tructae]|uniref:Uncharacterized protein n=1 Tax=Flavobacterium tructae TaxID=1114873 RepID=A0A1S1JAN7_9FLAO|nr:hypothetical protein [Flavobacterium tructae]OHT46850.1 hypothetical protein BHE19_04925 [Flavobacterium tructae]OXB21157.1 hypothetical protein B0A71_06105 [Flavobacterium tructae]
MKKKLEADLISIAHRILKLKNKSDINQLYLETQKLYEKLAVLKFVDENFDTLKPTIGHSEIHSEIEAVFEKEEAISTEVQTETPIIVEQIATEETLEPVIAEEITAESPKESDPDPETPEEAIGEPSEDINPEPEIFAEIATEIPEETAAEPIVETIAEPVAEITAEPIVEKMEEPISETTKEPETIAELSFTTISDSKPIPAFIPAFELDKSEEVQEEKKPKKEEPKAENPSKPEPVHISFEEILGVNYADAHFVKVDSFEAVSPTPTPSINEFKEQKTVETTVLETPAEPKAATLNEKLAKGFHIDLNDRIAFTKNLFGNSSEDYSRVLNQLLTFDTYGEAKEFIEDMVKPDYNNWDGKDDYAERFLGIVEKKFS